MSSNDVAGKKVKSAIIADWDGRVTEFFCKICVEEIEAGNIPHGTLTAKGYQNVVDKFAARTGRSYNQKQLKNRWDALKSLYDFWLSLAHTTGIGWDERLQTYSASDEFWENNTKRNKEKRALRFAPPANLKELEIMFEKSKVSGLSACIPGQAAPSTPIIDVAEMNTPEAEWRDEEIPTQPSYTQVQTSRGTKRKGKSPKKVNNSMVRMISKMVDDVIGTNSVTSHAVQVDLFREKICECIDLAKESGAYEGSDEHYIATRLFVKSENWAVFKTFESNEGRFNWLKRCYEDRKK